MGRDMQYEVSDMTTPDDRSIASLAEVFSAWARSGRLISR
jgi:hypothetical protein